VTAGPVRKRAELVEGRRVETVKWGLRTSADTVFHRKGHIEERDSLEGATQARDRPFSGYRGDEQVVTCTVVTYTTEWTVVPGHEGSPHLTCDHPGTPQGRTGPPIGGPDSPVRMEGPDYQRPHGFRERDMIAGADGQRRYTCPVCGLTWRHRDDGAPAGDPQTTLF
jgi:hypothetical protein